MLVYRTILTVYKKPKKGFENFPFHWRLDIFETKEDEKPYAIINGQSHYNSIEAAERHAEIFVKTFVRGSKIDERHLPK